MAWISWERDFFLRVVSPWPRRYAEDERRQGDRRNLGCSGGRRHGSLLEQDTIMRFPRPNYWLQATPGFALLFILAEVPDAPDAER